MNEFKTIDKDLLPAYLEQVKNLQIQFDLLKEAEISTKSFSFYTSVASVYSSKIEGENIELDSFIKHKNLGVSYNPDYTKKVDDLYNAYLFAQQHELTETNIEFAHKLLSKNLLESSKQGSLRTQNMYVATEDGRIEYVAVSPFELKKEMDSFYQDVSILVNQKLSIEEVFFYAAYIHLVFVKIHPWNDGNGRTARLIEKWFIATHLGEKSWFLQSEKNYYLHHQTYYENLRKLGLEYSELDYKKSLPFLLMLPACLGL